MSDRIREALESAKAQLENALANEELIAEVEKAGLALAQSFKQGGKVISCGNGGSNR